MANRRGFGYGYGNPYGGGRNAYSGKGIITRRSPFSKPFVDYSKEMGSRTRGWFAIHKEQFDKIDERVATNKAAYLKAMDEAQSAIYQRDGIQGHQKGKDEITLPNGDIIPIAGETADLQGLVEDYRQAYLKSRGIRKNKRGKLVGWGKSVDVTDSAVDARAEVAKVKGSLENAAAQKKLYMEQQNALYNDEGELNIVSGHTDEEGYEEYTKFMHPDNKTRYDKNGDLWIVSIEDGSEIKMSELSKLQPELTNSKLQTDINKTSEAIHNDTTGQFTMVDGDNNLIVNEQQLSYAADSLFNPMKDGDVRDISVNHSFEIPIPGEFNKDGTPKMRTVNFFNSDVSQAMQLIYQAQYDNDSNNSNSTNYDLILDRRTKKGGVEIDKHNKNIIDQIDKLDENDPNYAKDKAALEKELKGEYSGVKAKWFNDHNFVLDKDVFIEGSDARNNLIESLENSGMDEEDLNKALNFLSEFEARAGVGDKTMSISRYLPEQVKKFYKDTWRNIVQNKIDKQKAAGKAEAIADAIEFQRDMAKKWGPEGPKVGDLVARALNFKGVGTNNWDTSTPIDIERMHGMLTGINDGGKTGAKLNVSWSGANIPSNLNEILDDGNAVPTNLANLPKGAVITLRYSQPETTTVSDETTGEPGEGGKIKTAGAKTTKESKSTAKDNVFKLRYTGDKLAFWTGISNFLAGANIVTTGHDETGPMGPLGGVNPYK